MAFTVWIDADACPRAIKEVLYKAADRRRDWVDLGTVLRFACLERRHLRVRKCKLRALGDFHRHANRYPTNNATHGSAESGSGTWNNRPDCCPACSTGRSAT